MGASELIRTSNETHDDRDLESAGNALREAVLYDSAQDPLTNVIEREVPPSRGSRSRASRLWFVPTAIRTAGSARHRQEQEQAAREVREFER